MSRTIVYIDGLNLFYRALKGTSHKWLDIVAMSRASLPSTCQIVRINYYTARVSGRTNPSAPRDQHAYLRALATLSGVSIHYGSFLANPKWAGLVQPPDFRPAFTLPAGATPQVARVWKTEEKGSDVNLGAHLVRDAFLNTFDEAAVLTNDTDLVEPIRIVTQEVGRPITLLTPENVASTSLSAVCSHVRHIRPYLGACGLPDPIIVAGKKPIAKPIGW